MLVTLHPSILCDRAFIDAYVKHNHDKFAAYFNHATAYPNLREILYA